jgi:hypothetical protein
MTLDMNNLPRVETLQQLADFLRTLPANDDATAVAGFDMKVMGDGDGMKDTAHPCGSACCIGGWVGLLRPDLAPLSLMDRMLALKPKANSDAAYKTCWPPFLGPYGDDIHPAYEATPEQAAQAVEYLDKHGVCGWDEVMGVQS